MDSKPTPVRDFDIMDIEAVNARLAELAPDAIAWLALNPDRLTVAARQQSPTILAELRGKVVQYLQERLDAAKRV